MNSTRAPVLAVVRILIGISFLWIGVDMLMDHELLYGGLLHRLEETGGPVRLYQRYLPFIERNETSLVFLAAVANIGVGVFLVSGTLTSLASLVAAALVLNYALATSSSNYPHFIVCLSGSAVLLALGRLGAGLTWGLDAWLIQRFEDWLVLFPLRRKAPM